MSALGLWLPFLVLIGIWIFFMNRMVSDGVIFAEVKVFPASSSSEGASDDSPSASQPSDFREASFFTTSASLSFLGLSISDSSLLLRLGGVLGRLPIARLNSTLYSFSLPEYTEV